MSLSWPLEQINDQNEDVRSIQYFLNAHGQPLAADGIFGPLTQGAVRTFQGAHGLGVDGIVGNQTWPALIIQTANGSQGDAVRAVQSQANTRGAQDLTVDGAFGPLTEGAVKQFQMILGLSVDGIAGPITWNHFANGFLPGPSAGPVNQAVFTAWTQNDQYAASKNANAACVAALFSEKWASNEGWALAQEQGAAGTIFFTWKRSNGHQLVIAVSDGPAGYFYADGATFS
jgi:peptidoglycan hydrolase-like protein with peptidoglycan-binding domain